MCHFRSKIPKYHSFGDNFVIFDQKFRTNKQKQTNKQTKKQQTKTNKQKKNNFGLWVTEHNVKVPLGEE